MPILEKEVDLSPCDLLDVPGSEDALWYALHTKPRQEKVLLRRLNRLGKSFCGLLTPKRTRMPSGRVKTAHIPLFPGYVFLYGTEYDRYDAVCSGGVVQVLDVPDGDGLRADLKQIYEAILSGGNVTRVERLQPGQAVKVVSGPLAGRNGVFVRKKGRGRLLLTLSFIQQAAAVEIDEADIEAI